MAPFVYTPWQNPLAGSIAELIMAGPNARAAALQRAAAATARGQELAADAAAQGVRSIGQIAAGVPAQLQDAREAAQRQEANALRLDQAHHEAGANRFLADTLAAPTSLGPEDAGPRLPSVFRQDGDVTVIDTDRLSQLLGGAGYGDQLSRVLKDVSAVNDAHRTEAQLRRDTLAAQQNLIAKHAGLALGAIDQGMPPQAAVEFAVALLRANKSVPDDQLAPIVQHLQANPDGIRGALQMLSRRGTQAPVKLGDNDVLLNANDPHDVLASNVVPKPPTEASIAVDAAKGDATAQRALALLKPGAKKDEWDAFMAAYPQSLGKPTWDALTPEQQLKGFSQFTVSKQDPSIAALTKDSAALRDSLMRLQIGQQPTNEDAANFAKQLVEHKLAPSQIQLFGGFGAAGAAFKRMVGVEALKLEPEFNWEQAESDYQFAKSPGFQTTVRYMDSVQESMPRLLENATKLANGDVRFVNSLKNLSKSELNNEALKRFSVDALLVGDEVAKLLQGGGSGSATSDAKLKQASEIINTSDSAKAVKAALEEINQLITYRRTALTRGTFAARPTPPASNQPPTNPFRR